MLEAYYGEQTADRARHVWSATKSFTATGVGIAIAEGRFGLEDRIGELIPDRRPADPDPRAAG